MIFFAIVAAFVVFDILWWGWSDVRLRPLRWSALWRGLLAGFMVVQLGGFFAIFITRGFGIHVEFPVVFLASVYFWHLIVLPVIMLSLTIYYGILLLRSAGLLIARWTPWQSRPRTEDEKDPADGDDDREEDDLEVEAQPAPVADGPTRRQVLLAGVAAIPPLATAGLLSVALPRMHDLAIREMSVPVVGLPRGLHGLRIAHVTDSHVGRFTYGPKLDKIADTLNSLDADMAVFTGDLIDFALRDLPDALQMVGRFRTRYGTFICEGNHDLFEGRDEFEDGVRRANVAHLLVNQEHTLRIRGERVQMLGLMWGGRGDRRHSSERNMELVRPLIRPDAFPILLAHHPHAFDASRLVGVPLTLSGHTHGGQLMLNEEVGAGPIIFRYWHGMYQRGDSTLVISNGCGNWLPLRTPVARAEVLLLRLVSPELA